MPPVVAGISLVYNNARWVCRALDAVAQQTLVPSLHLVIDDGSTDDSRAVMREYVRTSALPIRFVEHEDNAGICARLNEGRALLPEDAELVFFCSDDLLDPDHLRRAADALATDPRAVAYFCAMEVIDGAGAHLGWRRPSLGDGYQAGAQMTDALFVGNLIGAPSVVMRAAALRAAGSYDDRFMLEDLDMWFRISEHGGWIYDSHPSVRYVMHGENLTVRRPFAIQLAIAQVVLKHLDKANTPVRRASATLQIADCLAHPLVGGLVSGDWASARRAAATFLSATSKLGSARTSFVRRFVHSSASIARRSLAERRR